MSDGSVLFHFYTCDPEKNIFCKKRDCYIHGGKCSLTSRPEYSTNGLPLLDKPATKQRRRHIKDLEDNS